MTDAERMSTVIGTLPRRARQASRLGSRAELWSDLGEALEPGSAESLLVLIAFDGLDAYEGLFGRVEAQHIVATLAGRLSLELGSSGRFYQPRSHEIAIILELPIDAALPLVDAALGSLEIAGELFLVTAGYGVTLLPDEAEDPVEAMMVADRQLELRATARRSRERRTNSR